jgi:hypothetical protein
MAKLTGKKTQETTTINVGAVSVTLEFHSTFTDTQVTTIKNKVILTLSEALQTI